MAHLIKELMTPTCDSPFIWNYSNKKQYDRFLRIFIARHLWEGIVKVHTYKDKSGQKKQYLERLTLSIS